MTLELNSEQEQIIREHLASGQFASIDEVLSTALAGLSQPKNFQPDAVGRMIEFAENKAVKLSPGEKVKDFIHEGHRY